MAKKTHIREQQGSYGERWSPTFWNDPVHRIWEYPLLVQVCKWICNAAIMHLSSFLENEKKIVLYCIVFIVNPKNLIADTTSKGHQKLKWKKK